MREIRCLFQLILRTVSDLRQAAGFVYTFSIGVLQLTDNFGGASLGGRESVGRVQAPDRGEGSAETQIHPCFQTSLGERIPYEWVIQPLREATPFGRQPRFLFRDNDGDHSKYVTSG